MHANTLSLKTPGEMARTLADRARALRLLRSWTRITLAKRAGVSVASLKRFENTGKASLELVFKVAHALGRLHECDALFQPPAAKSLAELDKQASLRDRKRGSR